MTGTNAQGDPIFDYLCEACDFIWESTDSSEMNCPECDSTDVTIVDDEEE